MIKILLLWIAAGVLAVFMACTFYGFYLAGNEIDRTNRQVSILLGLVQGKQAEEDYNKHLVQEREDNLRNMAHRFSTLIGGSPTPSPTPE